ncbi:MAG: extracellular solute-binding protein [Actinomycetota bacterium]
MEFRVLGELEVERAGEVVDIGAYRQRALLALLLTAPGTVFSTDAIIDSLWGETSGPDRQNSVWVYVSGLRKALDPDREKRSDGTVLLTRPPGYALGIDLNSIDSVRFEHMVAEGRLLATTDPNAASIVLGEALALWRGRPYEEFTYESFAQSEIARLTELRLEAVEARIEADLDRGLARELVSELESLVREHPLREAFTGQLMTALFRSGRQAESLRTYQHLATRLGEELGLEPSAGLQRLESDIITGQASADSPANAVGVGPQPGLAVRGYELRELLRSGELGDGYRAYQPAVGREVLVTVLPAALADDPDYIRRFEASAQATATIDSPHLVPLYDFWREPGAAYLVTRLLPAGDLAARLERGALPAEDAERTIAQIGQALAAAHRVGVTHCDLTTRSVLIDDDGNAYLQGLGRLASAADTDDRLADLVGLATVAAQALTGLSGDLEQIRGALPSGVRTVVDDAIASPASSGPDIGDFTRALRQALALGVDDPAEIRTEVENPYKGLRAFTAVDRDDFRGRERLVERLINRISMPRQAGRLIAIVGPSGSGKSSVARAGLLPALRAGAAPDSEHWFGVEMTPAPHPFEALEGALRSIAIDPPTSMIETLLGPDGIQRTLDRILPDDGSQVVVLVDQFEELFTQVDPVTSNDFVEALVEAVSGEQSRLRVVITLRADFYDRPLRHRGLGELLREGTEVITPMTPDELERAITGPLEETSIHFEPGLVAELVHDVIDRNGALPLLQYTLTELFEGRSDNRIRIDDYRAIGGVSGALVARADGLLARLGDDATEAARQVFLRLVTLGEGAEDTRRRVLRAELEQLPVDRRTVESVLDTFGRHRLLSFDRDPVTRSPTVEISHEALLPEWNVLHSWVDAARHDVRNQRRLADSMAEWDAADRDDAYLLRGGRLEQLHGWAITTSLRLAAPEQAYLDASITDRDRAADELAEQERRTADAETAARQRSRQLRIATAVGVLVAILAVLAISQWIAADDARDTADEERQIAELQRAAAEAQQAAAETSQFIAEQLRSERDSLVTAEEFAVAAEAALAEDPELALLYASEALRATIDLGFATEEAVDQTHWALQQLGVHFEMGPDPDVTVRAGPSGLTGVYILSPAELGALADTTTDRRLSDDECTAISGRPCRVDRTIPSWLPLRSGEARYRAEVMDPLTGIGGGLLSGTTVTIAVSTSLDIAGLRTETAKITAATGIDINIIQEADGRVAIALAEGLVTAPPDISVQFSPSLPEWTGGRSLDLGDFIDPGGFRADFGNRITDLLSVGGPDGPELRLIPVNLGPRDVVYYAKPSFQAAGYEIPTTFDELVAISEEVAAAGDTPWCFHWDAGSTFSGWRGTDLLEALVARSAGVDDYDRWVRGDLSFASPEVLEAARQAERLLFTDGFVNGGPNAIANRSYSTGLYELLDVHPVTGSAGPSCWFTLAPSSFAGQLGPSTSLRPRAVLGSDVGAFVLPSLEDEPATMVLGGSMAFASNDRPEVRAVMSFIASGSFGTSWAGIGGDGQESFTSINSSFDARTIDYQPQSAEAAAERTVIQDATLAAIRRDDWRFEASALLPEGFTGWVGTEAGDVAGPYWQAMVDWVNQTAPIEEIFARLDEQRAAIRAADG